MVIWEEVSGSIGSGVLAEYVDFKGGRLSDYEKAKEIYTSVTFACGVELYVCVCLVYVCVDVVMVSFFGVTYD
jgi:hypothetical protein